MRAIIITRLINAPIELVFNTVADIRNFSKAITEVAEYAKNEYIRLVANAHGTFGIHYSQYPVRMETQNLH